MSLECISWSETKRQRLVDQLTGFWAQDEWNIAECPLIDAAMRSSESFRPDVFRFTCLSPSLNVELKYACWRKFVSGAWSPQVWGYGARLHRIIGWLNQTAPDARSLLEKSQEKSALSLRSHLVEQGQWSVQYVTKLDRSQQIRQYPKVDPCASFFNQIYDIIQEAYDDREEYEKDIWDCRKLGMQLNRSKSDYKLNFTHLVQPWLRQAAKQYIRYNISIHSRSDCKDKLCVLNHFSLFLVKHYPQIEASAIDRRLIVEFLGYLSSTGLVEKTRKLYLLSLRTFFDLCAREGWARITERLLIYSEDIPSESEVQPRFIPQNVLAQLNQHIDALPPQIMRMTLVLQESGMRINELCVLLLDCLMQDASGDWFLRSYQSKMSKEHSIPISREAVAVIQEQQQFVKKKWGTQAQFLFPNAKGQPFKQGTFVAALNRMAYQHKICDTPDHLYRFTPHQFRHTVATSMINNGVPQHIVQRYLGHETPQMTARYAYILDQTMKQEYAKYRGKVVDVTGKVIEQKSAADTSDLQWMKKNILAQALSNGKCALPVIAGDCPHANACLTCVHFRTDASFLPQHKAQLEETRHLIQVARKNGWQRQAEMNEKVATNLERIITVLEEPDHGA
jgi:integrase